MLSHTVLRVSGLFQAIVSANVNAFFPSADTTDLLDSHDRFEMSDEDEQARPFRFNVVITLSKICTYRCIAFIAVL